MADQRAGRRDNLKANMTNCVSCHTLQRVFVSTHDADEFKQIFQRMGGYSPGSTPMHPQPLLPGPRADRSPMPHSQWDAMSTWLASVNLSTTDARAPTSSRRCRGPRARPPR